MGTHYGFIKNQLSTIQKVYDKDKLDCVYLYSRFDDSFSRLYIRWYVGIKLKDGWSFNYRMDEDYQSYELWGKSEGYRNFKEANYDAWRLTHSFSEVFDQYDADIQRFVEQFLTHFPDVKFYLFPSYFEFTTLEMEFDGRTHRSYEFHMSKFAHVNVLLKEDGDFRERSIYACKKEDILPEHQMEVLRHYENSEDAHARYKECEVKMRESWKEIV